MKKVVLVAVGSLLVFWLPFWLHLNSFWGIKFGNKASMETIVQNFDGLNFLVVEKAKFYNPTKLKKFESVLNNPPVYFTAHYPGYALVISFFDKFLNGPQAVLASIVIDNILLAVGLYLFFREVFRKEKTAIYLSILTLFLPARMMSVRAVGSTEPLFVFLTLMSLVYAMREKHWLAGIMGGLAVLTRSPGILLFGGYLLFFLKKYHKNIALFIKSIIPYSLIPLFLLGLWSFYGWKFGSFWAYFQSGDNLHLFFPPFQIFSNMTSWVSGMWLEDVIYLYLIFSIGLYLFWKQTQKNKKLLPVLLWGIIYFAVILLVAHRDVARYSLPIAPVVLAGYGDKLAKSRYRWWILWIIIPVFLWGWNFVLHNIQPISDWSAFL